MLSNIVIKFVHFTIKADFQFLKHIILLQFFKNSALFHFM